MPLMRTWSQGPPGGLLALKGEGKGVRDWALNFLKSKGKGKGGANRKNEPEDQRPEEPKKKTRGLHMKMSRRQDRQE